MSLTILALATASKATLKWMMLKIETSHARAYHLKRLVRSVKQVQVITGSWSRADEITLQASYLDSHTYRVRTTSSKGRRNVVQQKFKQKVSPQIIVVVSSKMRSPCVMHRRFIKRVTRLGRMIQVMTVSIQV
jgi:hypothetical protein